MKTVMIIAGESSGELYGSLLAKALKDLWPDVRLVGMGGKRMRDSGVEILSGISGAFGLTELASSIKRIRESFKKVSEALIKISPEVLVLIDYPDFNFRLARIAKRQGLKVLYYVSPQVWAWRKRRVRIMKEIADRVAVILPFEEEIYKKAGVTCEFVGHPAMEEIEQYELKMQDAKYKMQNTPAIALLPGSRLHELRGLLPVYLELVRLFRKESGYYQFILPLAPNIDTERFRAYINALKDEGVAIVKDGAIKCLASSEMAVIASGTATLQAALLGIPMVVVYKLSPITYLLGRLILDIKHISLVNIIAGRRVVSELIQNRANAGDIMSELKKIMYDGNYRMDMISSFREIKGIFSGMHPSTRVSEMIGEMAGWC
ncbi:MAG: lipid-A-disaccharide synthase [Thermodesulfovibrionales bacterium]